MSRAEGYLYAMSNRMSPGLLKLGMSMDDPRKRAAETITGSPWKNELVTGARYYVCARGELLDLEKAMHQHPLLAPHRMREGGGKEWFKVDRATVETVMRELQLGHEPTVKWLAQTEAWAAEAQRQRENAAQKLRELEAIERGWRSDEIFEGVVNVLCRRHAGARRSPYESLAVRGFWTVVLFPFILLLLGVPIKTAVQSLWLIPLWVLLLVAINVYEESTAIPFDEFVHTDEFLSFARAYKWVPEDNKVALDHSYYLWCKRTGKVKRAYQDESTHLRTALSNLGVKS